MYYGGDVGLMVLLAVSWYRGTGRRRGVRVARRVPTVEDDGFENRSGPERGSAG
jgi:hypothetical protein